jgi:hypothetical protein
VNASVLLVPTDVVTETVPAPGVAVAEIVKVVVSEVPAPFTVIAPTVMPGLDTFTAVAPVRLLPVRVTGRLVAPTVPDVGAMAVSAGGATTVNVSALLVPPSVVTVTFLAPTAAVAEIVRLAVTVVSVAVSPVTVTPPPDTVIPVAVSRLVPVRVIGTIVFRRPVTGAIEVSVGAGGLTTVNAPVRMLVVPAVAVTLMFLAEVVAVGAIAKVVVSVAPSGLTVTAPTVMPLPVTFTVVAPVSRWPVRVTAVV